MPLRCVPSACLSSSLHVCDPFLSDMHFYVLLILVSFSSWMQIKKTKKKGKKNLAWNSWFTCILVAYDADGCECAGLKLNGCFWTYPEDDKLCVFSKKRLVIKLRAGSLCFVNAIHLLSPHLFAHTTPPWQVLAASTAADLLLAASC